MNMKKYRLAAILMLLHGALMEVGGCLCLIPFGKYIPLVKHTSCTKMLEIPEDAFSEKILPMRIPSAIKRIAITSETRPANHNFAIIHTQDILVFSLYTIAILVLSIFIFEKKMRRQ